MCSVKLTFLGGKKLAYAGLVREPNAGVRGIFSRAGFRIMSVSSSTGTERPCSMRRTTVRSEELEMTTPLSPENGPKLMVTTLPLVSDTCSPRTFQLK